MPDYSLITAVVAFLVFLVIAVIAFKIIKGVLKTVVFLIALASIVLGLGAFFVVTDFNDFRENFKESKNLFLIVDGDQVISAMEAEAGEIKAINQQQTDEYSNQLKKGEREGLREDYYKIVILRKAVFDDTLVAKLNEERYPEERAKLLSPEIEKVLSEPLFLIINYKKGDIEVYEETAMFRAIKLLPLSLVSSVVNKAVSKTKSIVADKIEE